MFRHEQKDMSDMRRRTLNASRFIAAKLALLNRVVNRKLGGVPSGPSGPLSLLRASAKVRGMGPASEIQTVRRAVIDVGTNSVKLLVADVAGREAQPVCEQSHQTRLGQGFYETHRLRPEAIAASAQTVAEFAAMAREVQAVSVRVFATSAAREAVNREDLTAAIEKASGLPVEVISGEQEADWGFQGVTTNPELARLPLLLLDVGGGSTQCVFGRVGRRIAGHSFPLGTVRLMERFPCSDPPAPAELAACRKWLGEFLRREVRPKLIGELGDVTGEVQLVGAGGSASILGCMEAELTSFDRPRLEATRLSMARMAWHLERLWGMPLEARRQIIGLPKNRADVILMGAAIYHAVMAEFGFRELRISTRGLRFAALMQPPSEVRQPPRPTCPPSQAS
jgi:exopolyphosphatase / guanosine-5'-triphosphate,3'-diphosphate pyrophosphatase